MSYILGFAVGIIVAVAITIAVVLLIRKSSNKVPITGEKYDERQKLARGKAFKAAYLTLLTYGLLYGLLDMVIDKKWCDSLTGMTIGVVLSLAVFVTVCIFNDAYLSFKEKPGYVIKLFIFIALLNGVVSVMNFLPGHNAIIVNGILTYRSVNLLLFILFTVILTAMLIKRRRDRKDEDIVDAEARDGHSDGRRDGHRGE